MKIVSAIFYNAWKLHIGMMFCVSLVLFYPFLFLVLQKESWKKYSFPINTLWSRVMRMLCFYAVEVDGEVPKSKDAFVIIANHTSYLDIFLMNSILPNTRFLFMGKSEILSYPLVKTFFKRLNIPVFRGDRLKAAKAFIQAKREIKKGWSIVIFPEGRIPDHNPTTIPFKEGAFKLAKSVGIGIVPITFHNNYALFSDPEHFFKSAMPGLVKVTIHPHITPEQVESTTENDLRAVAFNLIRLS